MYSTPAEAVNIGIHYLGHSLAGHMVEYLMVDHMRPKHLSSVHPSFAIPVWVDKAHPDAPLARAQRTLNSFTALNVSIYFHDAASNLCFVCVVSTCDDWRWFLPSTSVTAVQKPLHLPAWCMHMCQTIHLPSIANPFKGGCYYAACQSNAAGEQMCVPCLHVFMDMKGEREIIFPLWEASRCVGFVYVLGSTLISHTRERPSPSC